MNGSYTIVEAFREGDVRVDLVEHVYCVDEYFVRHELHLHVGRQSPVVIDAGELFTVCQQLKSGLEAAVKRTEEFYSKETLFT